MRPGLALLALLPGAAGAAHLTVQITDPGDRAHLRSVQAAWRSAERDLRALGLHVPDVTLVSVSSAAEFARQTGEPWFVAATTRGHTIRTQRLGALAARGTLPLTVRHEAFHTAQPASLPRWLAEGLARLFSGEAALDPGGATGLEVLTDERLGQRLAARQAGDLLPAYREATRRARERVRAQGWARALGVK
ncbi:hypothetical protein [Deinococcus hopiensis]|uniref:DUF4157 domain-containing protein n=1 Tax=Deinococcus hopiensis KR-140 TaxID=695939 RepID=A0A1W1UQK7_9DEIO|nr:hypothetical protein [Deinococcus hopiensis]SMB83415.1 hypothetical protein SAMN00790413_04430 [Deinococcus hopiensis KR-140]